MQKRRTKITWTDEEREAVATEWALLRVEDPFNNPSDLLNKAQAKALSQHRRREGLSFAMDKRIRDLCLYEFRELTKMEPIVIPPPPPPPPVDPMEIIRQIPIIELRLYAERRWMEELLQRVNQPIAQSPTNTTSNGNGNHVLTNNGEKLDVAKIEAPSKPKAITPSRHFKVTLIGCLPDVTRQIQGKLPQDIDIVTVDKSRGIQPNILPVTTDIAIVHKASRDWFVLAEKVYGPKNVHFIQDRDAIVPKVIQQRSVWIAAQSHS
jgi:hypothetical protein